MHKLISIIVPVYNEETNIVPCYEALCEVIDSIEGYEFEIIFTDNCSNDRSYEILSDIAKTDERVSAFRFSRNFGYQRSIWTGFNLCQGAAAIEFDCDLQDPPHLIKDFLRYWETGAKAVYGIRRSREEGVTISFLRKVYYRLLNRLSDVELPVDAGDFMLVDRVILDNLKKVSDPNIYIRGLVFSYGFTRVGLPYDRKARDSGKSKFPVSKLISLAADGIIGRSVLPLRLSLFFGLLVLTITVVLSLFYLVLWIVGAAELPSGFTTLVLLVLFSTATNALLLGVFGEYLGRLYSLNSNNPMTIIEKSTRVADNQT